MFVAAWKKLVVHLLCRDMQANQAPEANEADGMDVIDAHGRQLMGGYKGDKARNHNNQAKYRQFFANIQKRFALFGSSDVAGITYGSDNKSHE